MNPLKNVMSEYKRAARNGELSTGELIKIARAELINVRDISTNPFVDTNPDAMSLIISVTNSKLKALAIELSGRYGSRVIVGSIDLLDIVTCPFAGECLKYCYGYDLRTCYKGAYINQLHNTNAIAAAVNRGFANGLVNRAITGYDVIRVSSNGDIIAPEYYNALNYSANHNPNTILFGYTKGLKYVRDINRAPNFSLVYSFGGVSDNAVIDLIRGGEYIPTVSVVNPKIDITRGVIAVTNARGRVEYIAEPGAEFYHDKLSEWLPIAVTKFNDYDFIRDGRSFGLLKH